jgi:hypothetical protein
VVLILTADLIQELPEFMQHQLRWSICFRMRKNYPSLMTYIGIAAVIIAIPVKLVFLIKLKKCSYGL